MIIKQKQAKVKKVMEKFKAGAWLLWGGDAGRAWAARTLKMVESRSQ